MRKKKPIRINESMLHKIIKESVKRVLRENESSAEQIWADEDKILRQNGLDPRLVHKLQGGERIPYYNDEMEDDDYTDYTDDYGIDVDTDTGDIRVWINGGEYDEQLDGCAVDYIKDLCDALKKGSSVEEAWYDMSYDWAL